MKERRLGLWLVLGAGITLLGGALLLRSRAQEREFAPPQTGAPVAQTSEPSRPHWASPPPSAAPESRSHQKLLALARKTIFERTARWSLGWAQSRFVQAPLPTEPEFWKLIEQIKKDLGSKAALVLGDLVGEASGVRTKELYVAILAGLQDPSAEPRLAELASPAEGDLRNRGLALYGLGLLKTDSAWKAALAAWRSNTPAGRSTFYSGLGLFGDRAAPLLIEEAKAEDFDVFRTRALSEIRGKGVQGQLWEITETSENDGLRLGAVRALTRDPSAATVSRLLDFIENPGHPADRRVQMASELGGLIRLRGYSVENSPQILDRILSHWKSLPAELQWSLLCDPAVRKASPGAIDGIEPPDGRNNAYIQLLAGDPARHPQLARYAASHPEDDTLMYSFASLSRQTNLSDPSLIDLARKEAFRVSGEETGPQHWAWEVLLTAAPELRAQAFRDAAAFAQTIPGELDRLKLVARFADAGAQAAPVALELLQKETSSAVRLDLLSTALSAPGHEGEVASLARAEIDQILAGVTDAGLRYASAYPRGKEAGLGRYGELLRRVFSAYGTPEDIPKIREYSSRMVMPDALGGHRPPNPESAQRSDYYREELQEELLNSIDAIRARYPESAGK